MSKGHQRRPVEISMELANLRWDIVFAKTEQLRKEAEEALIQYYEKKKTAYIEKRMLR